ncbi:MAG: Regulator of sigma-E protease RseP [Paracidovorax wautersii]|uniref:Zinc metalloprotease n=1 Tax=Paracidovorax wautersii TaxID=1177982 RepID=A0A7V8FS57_9BURK|nr:MAG: Regulator of sigma-E protease RseP [Paracidovorax wautersii]
MLTLVAFVVALGVLIAVHEYGHYRVAVAFNVRVLRFSIGFGHPILRWKSRRPRPGQDTEFTIGMLPLGGYVRMLDEREAPVAAYERKRAFNNQPLRARAAIVAAGPVANLLLAALLYTVVSWYGMEEARPVLAPPVAGSIAAQVGLRGAEEVLRVRAADSESGGEAVVSFDELRWNLTRAALDGQDLSLEVRAPGRPVAHWVTLPLAGLDAQEVDATLFQRIGLLGPWMSPSIGQVMDGSAAQRAGLQAGDVVRSVDGQSVADAQQLRALIQASASQGDAGASVWAIEREGAVLDLDVQPDTVTAADGRRIGRIGAYIGAAPEMVRVSRGPLDGLGYGFARTWEMSWLTLKMIGRMVIGEASIKNLSGPVTIADYAGKSASLGMTQYLLFLALISVSLGVLNLLPLPVLDGGHLLYYLWEAVTGKPVSDLWMERLQRGGVAVLLVMMSIALFNDFSRLLG